MSGVRTVSLVGSTGSIGAQAIEVLNGNRERFRVVALAASQSVGRLAEQARLLSPSVVAIADQSKVAELRDAVPKGTEVLAGDDGLDAVAGIADVVLNAAVGFAGLRVTLGALNAGRRLALANKESLIAGGPVVRMARRTRGAEIVPVDSEHCAVHQCLRSSDNGVADVVRIVLTASGGPFRGRSADYLAGVGVEDALAHPTWKMGPKITVDSSTLMNKGLEVLEANELFEVGLDRIDIVVHPQSIVHSFVEFVDGATIAQLSRPDMRLPIGYALCYPERLSVAFGEIDWSGMRSLEFEPVDRKVFGCVDLAFEAGRAGGGAPCWLNAANEVAVEAFLARRVPWIAIKEVVAETLQAYEPVELENFEDVIDADASARRHAEMVVAARERAA
ncbi:MAG: 1-deoxy-D-xylulose-5-phosphate reductoisomerase [Acidimicrobiales bacterium]